MTLNANELPILLITEELLNEHLLKPIIRIVVPVGILVTLGMIAIAFAKNIFPPKIAVIAEAFIKLGVLILIAIIVPRII